MKKLTAIILSLLMLANLTFISVNADNEYIEEISAGEYGFGLPQEGFYLPEKSRISLLSDSDFAEFEELLVNAMKKRREYVSGLAKFGYSVADDASKEAFISDFYAVVTAHPELYYVKTGLSYSISSGTVTKIYFSYNEAFDESNDEIFSERLENIIDTVVKDGMTDEEIALAVNDYLANHITYCQEYSTAPKTIFSAYGALVEQSAVCQGYALLYNLILNECGIDTQFVDSSAMSHAWSMISLDDEWYHVDVTWNDSYETNYGSDRLLVSHKNFLRSDTGIIASGHTVWSDRVPECTSTKYEAENYPFNFSGYAGVGTYTYKNGYFYMGNAYHGKYAKTKFDGSEFEYITLEQYNEALAAEDSAVPSPSPTVTPTPTPTSEPTPTPTVEPSSAPTAAPTAEPTAEPTKAPLADVNAVGKYADKISIKTEYSDDGERVRFVLNIADADISKLILYRAEFNDNGLLIGIGSYVISSAGSITGEVDLSSKLPESDKYKYMLWDQNNCPIIDVINNIWKTE